VIPLFHDFEGETVLVFGGGPVGARKARRFAREARVVVVSPEFVDADFGEDDGEVEFVRAAPSPADVESWFDRLSPALAVAATDDALVNAAVDEVARDRGVLTNRTDVAGSDRDPGSVVVPATARDGPVTVAIGTGGASPALSGYLRERIEGELDGVGEMASLTSGLREELKRNGVEPAARRAAIRSVVRSDAVWTALDSPGSNPRKIAADVISNVTGDTS